MIQKRMIGLVVALLLMAVMGAFSNVGAVDVLHSCKDAAIQDFKDAQGICIEAFQLARDTCLNRNHECVEDCRDSRETCLTAPMTEREAGILECNETLAAAAANCRAGYAAGSKELDACIDAAQVVAFQCRDDVREATAPAIRQCRLDFRACALACAPGGRMGAAETKKCLADARAAWATCKSQNRESFQSDLDGCLNRDHECVEDCRADRTDCLVPPLDQMWEAYETCADGRISAFDHCRMAFQMGGPSLMRCFDHAQVEAFQCRDQARETFGPQIRGCRIEFRQCARACPAPQP